MSENIISSKTASDHRPHHHYSYQVNSVQQLLDIPRDQLHHGMTVYIAGYYEAGDGGDKWVTWSADGEQVDNGGTIHDPSHGDSPGRWKVVHNGVGDFRWFGIFDHRTPADTALAAMVNDPAIRKIKASSDLWFQRRHTFRRSHIDIDFAGHQVHTTDIEETDGYDPFAAVLFFKGEETSTTQTVTLSHRLAELTDIFEVADASLFQVGDWWRAQVNHLAGRAERELDKLLLVTEIIDERHVRFNYMLGWELDAGRTIEYRQVHPVMRSHVRNMVFYGAGNTLTTGSHPVAYEWAVECDTSGIEGHGTFWPLIMRRHCTYYEIKQCRLYNPVEVLIGGTGYLAQQINCLYGHIADCYTSNARHLNDFTGSAYCLVENCHNSGDDLGAFVTHGQYEHDLVYSGNSGLISFANSGPTWGESAKRITVKKHTATRFIAHRKVTDLTLEDVEVFEKEGLNNSGTIWLNCDGVHMNNCTAAAGVTFIQMSSRSSRPNVVQGCSFYQINDPSFIQQSVTSDITFQDCYFYNIDGCTVEGTGRLTLIRCHVTGYPTAEPMLVANPHLTIHGGYIHHSGITLNGSSDQTITIDGGVELSGTNAQAALLKSNNEAGVVQWNLGNYTSSAANEHIAHLEIISGKNKYKAVGATFSGGQLILSPEAFGQGSYLLHTSCVENDVHRAVTPPESETIRYHDGNLILKS